MTVTIKRVADGTYRLLASDGGEIREYNQTKMVLPRTGFRTPATLVKLSRGRTTRILSMDGKPGSN